MSNKQENSEKKTHEDERIEDKSKKEEARGEFGRFFTEICIYITGIVLLAVYIYLMLGKLEWFGYEVLIWFAIIFSCIVAILVNSKHPILLFVITLVIFLGFGSYLFADLLAWKFGSY